ncbi:MAG: extracellular solute-binding protein [Gammaproteobacteria bacterium]|nr:extracellular solute-binding protein [Gammaproteobacteria bacterium]
MLLLKRCLVVASLLLFSAATLAQVNIYSSRKEALILPLLQQFTADTGIQVKLLTGKDDALLRRLALEGMASPADLLITTDVARLHRAKQMQLTQAVDNGVLQQVVPVAWRDKDHHWFGVTSRARPIVYAPGRVAVEQLGRYEDLADSQWRGRLCLRSSDNVYNQSLVAAALIANGPEQTLNWMQGMVANLSKPPAGGDTDQLKAVAAGICDLTLVNTYYLARLQRSDSRVDNAVAGQLAVFWPNQSDRGAHFNISGMALTKASKHKQHAIALMEYMVSEQAQRWYADVNNEYPVVAGVPMPDVLAAYGQPKADTVSLTRLGELNQQVIKLMDQARWR